MEEDPDIKVSFYDGSSVSMFRGGRVVVKRADCADRVILPDGTSGPDAAATITVFVVAAIELKVAIVDNAAIVEIAQG